MEIKLRAACESDAKQLWEWVNDPDVRASAFNTADIPWETHIAWFTSLLANPLEALYIAEDESGRPMGKIRFTGDENGAWEIGISVARNSRGLGIGKIMVQKGSKLVFDTKHAKSIYAWVKVENKAALGMYESLKFLPIKQDDAHKGGASILLVSPDGEKNIDV